jgi:hypothetical protein
MTDQASRYAALQAKMGAATEVKEEVIETPEPKAEAAEPVAEPAEPAAEPVASEPSEPSAAAKAEAEELFPGYSTLSDDARAKIDAIVAERDAAKNQSREFEHKFKSQLNLTAPTQRKLRELQTEIERLRSAPRAPSTTQSAPSAPTAAQAANHARLAKLRNELPEEAAAIEEAIAANLEPIRAENAALKQSVEATKAYIEELEAKSQLNSIDPDWKQKTESDDFAAWADAIADEASEFFDPMMAEAIARAKRGYDVNAMKSILRQFNRDLAEADAAMSEPPPAKPASPIRKPTPDPSLRRPAVAVTNTPRTFVNDQERRMYELKQRLGR